MLFDQTVDDLAEGGQTPKGRFFVLPHEATVAMDVGTENGGKSALHLWPA
jgi:hypothetical protein